MQATDTTTPDRRSFLDRQRDAALADKNTIRRSAIAAIVMELNAFPQMNDTVLALAAADRVRAVTGEPLNRIAPIVRAAIPRVRDTNLDRHRVASDFGWVYRFPNGHEASVVNDPSRPFRFEVLSDDPADVARGRVSPGLTSEQVEAKLHTIAALPTR